MLNLTSVFAGEGSVPFRFALDLSDLDFYGNHPFRNKAEVSGRVENRAGIVTLKATVSFVFSAPCDRCGVPVEKPYCLTFEHIVVTDVQDEENDGLILADNMQLDAEELIRDDMVLWVPLKFLCRDDCKGLCDACGKNLNEGPCDCAKDTADPRLAILESLLNTD